MNIAFSRQNQGRDVTCLFSNPDTLVPLFSPLPTLRMTLDATSSHIGKIAGDRAKSSVVLAGVHLDNAAPEHRLIRPRCGFSNTER